VTGSPAPRGGASRRPAGVVLEGLIAAGLEQARAGGADAVVLRDATRTVGVSPNAAYRYFADREELLAAVAWEAVRLLSQRMQTRMAQVTAARGTAEGARQRLRAVGLAYLEFARQEPGLFGTAFAVPARTHERRILDLDSVRGLRTPLEILDGALDELEQAGVLPADRRPAATVLAWSAVHGLATLRAAGPLPPEDRADELDEALAGFIGRGLTAP
jgi:AcrR family transcriptional regulator